MDAKEVLLEILKSPSGAAFSRIRYVGTLLPEEEQKEFLRGLYQRAVEARESGSLEALADYLEGWEDRGQAQAGARARAPQVEGVPWAALRVPIRQARVALLTTGGFYIQGQQEPFQTDGPEGLGDWTFRAIPRDTPRQRIGVSHAHYDLSGPREDVNCVFPLDVFVELEREGVIGSLAQTTYSFMGYIQRPEALMSETVPEVARRLKQEGVDAVVLTST